MASTLYNLFQTLHQYAQTTVNILDTKLGTILDKYTVLDKVVERFGLADVSLFSFMFGAGLTIFLIMAIIKFVLAATPLL